MKRRLQKLLGLGPAMPGLEQTLEQVRLGHVASDDAAERIRDLAAEPHVPRWVPRLLRLTGIAFGIGGLAFLAYSITFSFGTEVADAKVVEMDGGAPIVEYHVDGKRFEFHSRISSTPPDYFVGDDVVLLYSTTNPKRAQIDSFSDRWLFPLVFMGAGLLSVGFSFWLPWILGATQQTCSGIER